VDKTEKQHAVYFNKHQTKSARNSSSGICRLWSERALYTCL